VSHANSLRLDASRSQDPDADDDADVEDVLDFAWSCSIQVGPVIYACSDMKDKQQLVFDNTAILIVPAFKLAPTTTSPYIFTLTVTDKEGLKSPAVYKIPVTVVNEIIPSVSIEAGSDMLQQADGTLLVNAGSRMTLLASCDATNATYSWSFSPALAPSVMQDASIFPLGTSSTTMVVLPGQSNIFPGSSYTALFQCTIRGGGTGVAQVAFDINTPPAGSGCEVCKDDRTSPVCQKTGMALIDQFSIKCNNFADKDIPLQYFYGYRVQGSSSPDINWFAPTASKNYMSLLPKGLVSVYAYVADKYGASSRLFVSNVTVTGAQPASSRRLLQLSAQAASTGGVSGTHSRRVLQLSPESPLLAQKRQDIAGAVNKSSADEVNNIISVVMTEILSAQGSDNYGLFGKLTIQQLQDFISFAVKSVTTMVDGRALVKGYACSTMSVVRQLTTNPSFVSKETVMAVSALATKLVTPTDAPLDNTCSLDTLEIYSKLLTAQKTYFSDSTENAAILLQVCAHIL
jgi:hypothetical protein